MHKPHDDWEADEGDEDAPACECEARPDWLHALHSLGFALGYVLRLAWRAAWALCLVVFWGVSLCAFALLAMIGVRR